MKIELTLTAETDEIYEFAQNQANDAIAKTIALMFHYATAHPEAFAPLLGILSQIKMPGPGKTPSAAACLNCGGADASEPCSAPGKTPVPEDMKAHVEEKNGHVFIKAAP